MDSESGFDELMRLSQKFTRQKQEDEKREQQRARQRKKVQDVLGGLKEMRFAMAIEQLRQVSPEMAERVELLKSKPGSEDLRKLISDFADELEEKISDLAGDNPDLKPLEGSMRVLVVLLELYFSLS